MSSSTIINIFLTTATGSTPATEYDYLSFGIALAALILIFSFIAFYWLVHWLLIGLEAFIGVLNKLRGVDRRRNTKTKP